MASSSPFAIALRGFGLQASGFGALLLAAGLTFASAAGAEPTAAEKETARGLMAEGRARRDKNDLQAALQSFQGADAIMHVPSTGYEVAKTQEMMGQLVEARDTLLRVLRIPETPNEPAPFKEARTKAQQLSEEIEARIPSLKIAVTGGAPGAEPEVTVDKVQVPSAAMRMGFKVNPGHHVVVAKTEGATGKTEIDIAERETKDVSVALVAAEKPKTEETATEDKPQEDKPPPEPPHTGSRWLTYTGFGVAAVGVVVGTVTGILTFSDKSSASNGCKNNQCPPSTYNDIDAAKSMATISTVSFIVAGAGAAVGIVSLLVGGGSSSSTPPASAATAASARPRVSPWIGIGAAGV